MAERSVVSLRDLAAGTVLAPERYDPRRQLPWRGPPLGSLAQLVTDSVPSWEGPAIVLDTSHVSDGVVRPPPLDPAPELGSARRVLLPGDVVISRLRPYLRQIAWVDPGLWTGHPEAALLGSPELLALRPTDPQSLAFLVPLLLSAPVQRALAAAQEGSHHPRVPRDFLASLPVPGAWLAERAARSAAVEEAIAATRAGAATLAQLSEAAATSADSG